MPLPPAPPTPNVIPIPLTGGVETKIDPRLVPPPKLLQQQNMNNSSLGALTTRYPLASVPNMGTNRDDAQLFTSNDELVGFDANNLYAYTDSTTTPQWNQRGIYGNYALNTKGVSNFAVNQIYSQSNTGGVRNLSVDYIGNVGIMVWDDGGRKNGVGTPLGGTVYMTCFDAISGRPYWQTSTKGFLPAATPTGSGLDFTTNNFPTTITPTIFPNLTVQGAMQPCIKRFQGKWAFFMLTALADASTGLYYALSTFLITPGSNGPPAMPSIVGATATNISPIQTGNYPFPFTKVSSTATNAFYSSAIGAGFEPTQFYYDVSIKSDGTGPLGIIISASNNNVTTGAMNTSSANLPYLTCIVVPNVSFVNSFRGTIANNILISAANVTGAVPVTIADPVGSTSYYFAVAMSVGVTGFLFNGTSTVTGDTFQLNYPSATFFAATATSYNPNTTGLFTWPGAVVFDVANLRMIVNNGLTIAIFPNMTATGLTNASNTNATIKEFNYTPMAAMKPLPNPTGGQSVVASRMIQYASQWCMWFYQINPNNSIAYPVGSGIGFANNMLLLNVETGAVLARAFYIRAFPVRYGTYRPPNFVLNTINGVQYAVAPGMVLANSADSIVSIRTLEISATQTRQLVPVQYGSLLTGADTKYYDGYQVRSMGWQRWPDLDGGTPVLPDTQAGGLLLPNKTYTYIFVLADYDAYGNAIYSSPSVAYPVTLGASNNTAKLNLTDVWPGVTGSTSGASLQIYRNTSANQIQYFKAATLSVALYGTTTTYYDTSAEALSGNALLYSPPTGGELPNDPPPPSTCATANKSRAFVASAEEKTWLYYSKPFNYGRAVEFNAAQYIVVDPSTGPIVGLAAMDDTIVIFKANNIYLLSGVGPDATGVGNFNDPQRLATDTGLQDVNSLVTTSMGVFFRSSRGIELLNRGFASQYIGQPVEKLVKGLTVTKATVIPRVGHVSFTIGTNDTITYDYTAQTWYTNRWYALTGYNMISQAYWNSVHYFGAMAATGTATMVKGMTTGNLSAADYFVFQTPWIPVAGQNGVGRIRRVNFSGYFAAASTGLAVNVQFNYDFGQTNNAAQTAQPKSVNVLVTANASNQFSYRVRAPAQLCRNVSIQFTIIGDNVPPMTITDVTLETSTKTTAARLSDSASS